jgi:hypothetical protein
MLHRKDREREGNQNLGCNRYTYCIGANITFLNWQRPLWEGHYEVVKRSGRDEPVWVVTHISMETTQEISLYSYLYLKLAKMLFLYIKV